MKFSQKYYQKLHCIEECRERDKRRIREYSVWLLKYIFTLQFRSYLYDTNRYMKNHFTIHLVGVTRMWKVNGWTSTNTYIHNKEILVIILRPFTIRYKLSLKTAKLQFYHQANPSLAINWNSLFAIQNMHNLRSTHTTISKTMRFQPVSHR